MLSCREVTEKASDYLDRTLPWGQRLGMRLHILMCQHCRRYLRQIRAVVKALGLMPAYEVPAETVSKQVEALKEALKDCDERFGR